MRDKLQINNKRDWAVATILCALLSYLPLLNNQMQFELRVWFIRFAPGRITFLDMPEHWSFIFLWAAVFAILFTALLLFQKVRYRRILIFVGVMLLVLLASIGFFNHNCKSIKNIPYNAEPLYAEIEELNFSEDAPRLEALNLSEDAPRLEELVELVNVMETLPKRGRDAYSVTSDNLKFIRIVYPYDKGRNGTYYVLLSVQNGVAWYSQEGENRIWFDGNDLETYLTDLME